MKLKARRKDIAEAFHVVGHAVSGRSTLPILSNVLLEVRNEQLRLLASDLEMWLECALDVDASDAGAITVPARILGELLDRFTDEDVVMTLADEAGPLTVTSGKAQYELQCLPAQEFPAAPQVVDGTEVKMAQQDLRSLIRSVTFAASTDETRAVLTGALVRCEVDKMMMAATDMHRLAVNTTAASVKGETTPAVVPVRALNEVARALTGEGDVLVSIGEGQIRFDAGQVCVVSRLVEGQFPDYKRFVNEQPQQRMQLDREELLVAIRRAAVLARAEANKVVLKTQDGVLSVRAESADVGRGSEQVPVTLEGGEVEIAFNAEYLIDVLAVLDCEKVEIGLTGPLSPGFVRPIGEGPFVYVVMPMAIL
jgi:DNA polymerase-3 subunit beta